MKKSILISIVVLILLISMSTFIVYADNSNEENIVNKVSNLTQEYFDYEIKKKELEKNKNILDKISKNGKADEIIVLKYNLIEEKGYENNPLLNGSNIVVLKEDFIEQINYLKSNNFYFATEEDLLKFITGKLELPKKTVVLTFDGGYKSLSENVYPILKENNIKAISFLPGDNIKIESDKIGVPFLNYFDVQNLDTTFSFQSLTYNLFSFDEKGHKFDLVTTDEIIKDFKLMKEKIEPVAFAYPSGATRKISDDYFINNGIKLVFNNKQGKVTKKTNKYDIPRYEILNSTTIDEFKKIVN